MNRILLDTHAFIWFVLNDPQLSSTARDIIGDPESDVYLSAASIWEMGIKTGLGKLSLTEDPFSDFIKEQLAHNDIKVLPIEIVHVGVLTDLPLHHKDPFDRLLVAQSIAESIPLVSV